MWLDNEKIQGKSAEPEAGEFNKSQRNKICFQIRKEIDEIANGSADAENNVLMHAPHTQEVVISDHWDRPYSREKAVYPLPFVRQNKFWPQIGRINNAHGDKNLICSCPSVESYDTLEV